MDISYIVFLLLDLSQTQSEAAKFYKNSVFINTYYSDRLLGLLYTARTESGA